MKDIYAHYGTSEKYLRACFYQNHPTILKNDNCIGVTITRNIRVGGFVFPLSLTYYTSIARPKIKKSFGLHIIFWNKIKTSLLEEDKQKEKGFIQFNGLFLERRSPVAYLAFTDSDTQTYFTRWTSTLKNHRNKWQKNISKGTIHIGEVSLEVFSEAYKNSSLPMVTKKFCLKQMSDFKEVYGTDIHFYIVRDSEKNILAGTAIVDDFETSQSIYQYAFTDKRKVYKYIGVGLIDHCVQHMFEKGFYVLSLTSIWDSGQPNSWRGFSDFKLQFNPNISRCRNAYLRVSLSLTTFSR